MAFRPSTIGIAPEDDTWNAQGPDSMWGINPQMRSAMTARNAADLAAENLFSTQIKAGMSPVQLALADPYRFYQRTGQGVNFIGNEPTLFTPGSSTARDILGGTARAQGAETGMKNAMLIDELDRMIRGADPISRALSALPPGQLEEIARIKSGFTEQYGGSYGGRTAPSKYEGELGLVRGRNEPAMAAVAQQLREWEGAAPQRAQALKAGEIKISQAERQQQADALKSQIDNLTKFASQAYDTETGAAVMDTVKQLQHQWNQLVGVPEPTERPQEVPMEISAQYPPAKYRGKTLLFKDRQTGAELAYQSDGTKWSVVRYSPTQGQKTQQPSKQQQQQRGQWQ